MGLLVLNFGGDAPPREGQDDRANRCDDQQNEGVCQVDPVLDAPGWWPAAEVIADDTLLEHLDQERYGHGEGGPADRRGQDPSVTGPAQQDAERRRKKRKHHLQCGQMGRDHVSVSWAMISSSSTVP